MVDAAAARCKSLTPRTHPRTYYAVLRSTTVVQFFGRQNDDDAGGFEQSYDFWRVPRQKLILKKHWSEYFDHLYR